MDAMAQKLENPEDAEQYALIAGMEEIPSFRFIGSTPVHFEHDAESALLTLEYKNLRVTFEFAELEELNLRYSAGNPKIQAFSCTAPASDRITADIGELSVVCRAVRVLTAEKTEPDPEPVPLTALVDSLNTDGRIYKNPLSGASLSSWLLHMGILEQGEKNALIPTELGTATGLSVRQVRRRNTIYCDSTTGEYVLQHIDDLLDFLQR